MKLQLIPLVVFIGTVCAYFSSQQLEIINAHYAIQPKSASSKESTTRSFYDILNVDKSTPMDKVEKSFRKLSKKFHPDKFLSKPTKERKRAERKYETFGIIMNILRDVQKREAYDYFLHKGFPEWDARKQLFIYKHKSSIPWWPILTFGLIFITLINFIVVKLNKNSKSKQINQIIRDVNWKADNLGKSSPKVMEIPKDMDFTKYSLDDKLIDYLNKPFIVKADKTVFILDDDFPLESDSDWSHLAERIVEDGDFQLFGFTKADLNRKERRLNAKKKQDDSVKEPKLKWKLIESIDPSVKFSDLIWGKLFKL